MSIAQTTDGYLWLGTEFGLVRFDGVRFVPSGEGAGPSAAAGYLASLLAARDGTLWAGTINGLISWRAGKFTAYPELAGKVFMTLLEDHAGTIWAGGPAGLCAIQSRKIRCDLVDKEGHKSSLGPLFGNGGVIVYSLFEDSEDHLWVGTESGIWQWTPGPPRLYSTLPIKVRQSLVEGEHGQGMIVLTGGEDRRLQQKGPNGIEPLQISGAWPPFQPEALLRDHRGALWIGTTEYGLWRVQDGVVTHFSQENGLSGNLVSSLFEDREGTVWVGTINGLDRFREPAVSTISTREGLSTPVGCVLSAHDGSLWVGSYLGLNRWKLGQMTRYRATPAPPATSAQDSQGKSPHKSVREITDRGLQDNAIDALYEDPRGRIWVGTNHGVAWFEDGKFTPVKGEPLGVATAIFGDADQGVWVSSPAFGLNHVINGTVVQSLPWPWPHEGRDLRVSAVTPDSITGGVWVGFWDGGVSLLKEGQVQRSLAPKDGLGTGTVWSLYIDDEKTLWAATEGGLSRIRDDRVSTLTTQNGLPCDAVHWMIEDNAFTWVNTACGLLRIDRSQLDTWALDSHSSIHPVVLDRADGIKRHAFTEFTPVVTRSVDGRLWMAHWDGVTALDPLRLPINQIVPPVLIEQILADGKTFAPIPGLGLPGKLRDITINYTALSLVDPDKVRFRFKLEGQDPEWREVLNVRQVEYSNLAPGHYRFRVIAANNSGIWNRDGASLDFSIAPAYWQTNWFRALCAAAFGAAVWSIYRLRLRQAAREFERGLDARVAERTRIARELHDTLLQSFHGLLLRFQTVWDLFPTRPLEAREILGNAIDQASKAITEGREAVQGLRSSTQEPNDLAAAIGTLGAELAADPAVTRAPTLRVGSAGPVRLLHPIIRDEIYRIAGEALRNAFQHSQGTRIDVELRYDEQQFRLRIYDDGKGIDGQVLIEGGRSGHYGLRGMRERAEIIGAKLTLWSAPDSGTEVELILAATRAYAKGRAPEWESDQ